MKYRKIVLKIILYLIGSLVGLAALCLMAAFFVFSPSRDEVARVHSPSQKADAVLIEINGGATTSFGYSVYVVKNGSSTFWHKPVANLYGAVRNDQAYGVNLKWYNSTELGIEYFTAKSASLAVSSVNIGAEMINVQLRSGVNDPFAPAGGMLYNLEKKM
jgi:hypothetical protein